MYNTHILIIPAQKEIYMDYSNETKEVFNKYTIARYDRPERGWVCVRIINNNAKVLWKATKYHLSFRSNEERESYITRFKIGVDAYEALKLKRRQDRKNDNSPTPTKVIKKALSEKYGAKNVTVVRGKGTAYGWVTAQVCVSKVGITEDYSWSSPTHKEAVEIAYKAMKENGLKFYTYYSDDYSDPEPRDEFMLEVRYV